MSVQVITLALTQCILPHLRLFLWYISNHKTRGAFWAHVAEHTGMWSRRKAPSTRGYLMQTPGHLSGRRMFCRIPDPDSLLRSNILRGSLYFTTSECYSPTSDPKCAQKSFSVYKNCAGKNTHFIPNILQWRFNFLKHVRSRTHSSSHI